MSTTETHYTLLNHDGLVKVRHTSGTDEMPLPRLNLKVVIAVYLTLLHLFSTIPANAAPTRVTILFTHDLHSNILPHNETATDGHVHNVGGFARMAEAISQERKRSENSAILLDAGDFSGGTLFNTLFMQEAFELRLMGILGYDAVTFGNNDFCFSPSGTIQMLKTARKKSTALTDIVISNLHFRQADVPGIDDLTNDLLTSYPLHNYKIIELNGLRIGILGLLGKSAAWNAPYLNPLVFSDPVHTGNIIVKHLKENKKADLILCLSHCGTSPMMRYSEDEILAKNLPDIDVIISGHSHTVLHTPIKTGKTLIVSAGASGTRLGVLELKFEKGKGVMEYSYRLRTIDQSIPSDRHIAATISEFRNTVDKQYLSHFGYHYDQTIAQQPFNGTSSDYYNNHPAENGLGNLVADAYRYAAQTETQQHIDAAVTMLSSIRAPLCKGNIKVSDIFRTLSLGPEKYGYYGNTLVLAWLTGNDLKKLLEIETSIAPRKKDAHLSVSGIRFSYNPNRVLFDRITSIEIEGSDHRFHPLEKKRLYSVVITPYLIDLIDMTKNRTAGILHITLKNKTGKPVTDTGSLTIMHNTEPLREWIALARYLSSFPEKNGTPSIPQKYADAEGRILVQPSWNPVKLVADGNLITMTITIIMITATLRLTLLVRKHTLNRFR